MAPEQLDTINRYWKQIFHALKKASKPVLAELGLTKVDANVIWALSCYHPQTKAQLADSLSFRPNALTRSLERLTQLGWIKKVVDVRDQRFVQLSLTAEGQQVAVRYRDYMRAWWQQALNAMTPESVQGFEQLLSEIHSTVLLGRDK